MKMKTVDAAVGRWEGILINFGIEENYLRNRHGPCPICNGRDRFRWDNKDGRGTYICNQCGAGDGLKLLMEVTGWDFKEATKRIDEIIGNVEVKAAPKKVDPRIRLRKIAAGVRPMEGINPVRLYLKRRGLRHTSKIKWNPEVAYYNTDGQFVGKFPAMVCLFESPEGEPVTYHITHLTQDGQKAPVENAKKLMPPHGTTAGGAIRLTDVFPHIGIAEGIETALAVIEQFGIPCWAAYSAGLLEQFFPPVGVEKVTIFGDSDTSFTGQKSAYVLANRLQRQFEVEVMLPETMGTDFADCLG